MVPRLYLIDSHGQLYASYYAIRALTSPKGEPTGATFGFVATLLKILREERPEYLAACFDMPGPTRRHEAYAQYKAHRKPMPEDLPVQIGRVREILRLLGVPAVDSVGYEADDCIAAMVERGRAAGMDVVICSRDKDLEQLVGAGVTMLDTKTFERLDTAAIERKRGVSPKQMIDLLALMGDASDNIPGVPGVGEKTATRLIAEYGSLDELLARADQVKGKLGERLRAHTDDALRSRDLVRLLPEAPLDVDLDACRTPESHDTAELVALFRDLGFNRFIDEFGLEGTAGGPGIKVHIVETKKALADLAKALAAQPAFAFDTETTSLVPGEAHLVGLSLAWSEGEGYYVPLMGPEQERCLDLETVKAALGPVLAARAAPGDAVTSPRRKAGGKGAESDPLVGYPLLTQGASHGTDTLLTQGASHSTDTRLLVGQNVKYDMLVCRRAGLEVAEPLFDTMVAAYLANPGRRQYNLDALALDYFGHKMIPLEDLLGPKKSDRRMDEVPIDDAAEYAVEDAVMTWRLKERLAEELEEKGLSALARDVEMPLVPVLASMEETGVAIDVGVLAEISADLESRLAELEKAVYQEAGHAFAINSPQQLATVLFEELGLKAVKKTAKGKRPSTDAGVLEELAPLHPLPRLVLAYRQLAKLKGTYVDALPALVSPETGRVHTSFNQTVTATGRLSSSEPNLQNIPIRTDEGRQIRRAFVPGKKNWVLLAADYSQIELRMLAHYSGDPALVRAFAEDRDIHTFVAGQIYGVEEAEVTYEMRRVAKVVNFSLIYGKTAYGLSRDLGISVGEAGRFIDDYFDRYRGVRDFTAEVLARAKADGYVTTILGRRRFIEGIDQMDPKRLNFPERTAVNTVIQGSAADLIKVAMNRIWRRAARQDRPSRLLIQIHDELIFETPRKNLDAEQAWITEEMVGAMELVVPLKVNVASGKNWMEAE
ncbi:MAG TPA: DNA polymerase I [Phycisphaerae bacterium]|nr:DNA polymerase I [Phycisphaerae bacterium]